MVASYLLNIVGIGKAFDQPAGQRLVVLQEVNLKLRTHEIFAVMGVNGSGKTTLLNIIGGELRPDYGDIDLEGKSIIGLQPHQRYRKIGRVHQDSYKGLSTELTVGELLIIAQNRNRRLKLRRVSAFGAIDETRDLSPDLSSFLMRNLDQQARILSGGQRQLLCLALAALGYPKLLLLDEHLASLDEGYTGLADSFLSSLVRDRECAVLAITHSRAWAEANCTNIGELESGFLNIRCLSVVKETDQ